MAFQLAQQEWRVRISAVRLGHREYRVVRPADVPGLANLYEGYRWPPDRRRPFGQLHAEYCR